MKVNHEERFEWSEPDQFDYTPPPLREGDEMANPLNESDGIQDELDDLESELGELGESELEPESEPPEEDPSIGDAGSVTQR
jgi:hypothetical protein